MKTKVVLLSILTLLLTGCNIVKLDNNDIDKTIDTMINKKSKLNNVYFDGYKYYMPRGMKFINKDEYNALFKDRYKNMYFLYVDVVSYYHKIEIEYEENHDIFYSKKLDDKGYIEINEVDNKYFVEILYNYAKIEAYVSKRDMNGVITNALTILTSIKYNNKVLESIVGNNILNYKEEVFDIFKARNAKKNKENFLEYVEEYDTYEEDKRKIDEDNLEIDVE